MRWQWFCFSAANSVRACYGRHAGYQFSSSQATPLRDYTPKQQQKTVVELAVSPMNVLHGTRTVKDERGMRRTEQTSPWFIQFVLCHWCAPGLVYVARFVLILQHSIPCGLCVCLSILRPFLVCRDFRCDSINVCDVLRCVAKSITQEDGHNYINVKLRWW